MQFKKSHAAKAALFASLGALSASSFAALPAAVGTTVTEIQSNAQGIFDLIFPVMGFVLGLVIVVKLFKKFTSKI